MKTQQAQIKINLPVQLKDFAESKANKFGLPLAGYLKHLIIKDVEDMDFPTYTASSSTEKDYLESIEEEKAGKLIKVKNIKNYFNNL